MLTQKINAAYIHAAMGRAIYKSLEDDAGYFGEIPGFSGIWASALTLEACSIELAETLEDWLNFSLSRQMPVPELEGVKLLAK